MSISVPGGRPRECVATDKRCGGEREWRSTAANVTDPSRGPAERGGILLRRPWDGRRDQRSSQQMQGCVATDERRGGEGCGGPPPQTRPAMRGRTHGGRHCGQMPGERGVRPAAVDEAAEITPPRGQSREYVAADERRGGGLDRIIQDNLGSLSKLCVNAVSCGIFAYSFNFLTLTK